MRFIFLSPPDTGHVYTSIFLVNSLVKRHSVTYYGFKKHKKTIKGSGVIFSQYPKEIEDKIWLASPYNLPEHTPVDERKKLIETWEENKTNLSFALIEWLFSISHEYDAIVMDVVFYQRTGFVIPCITKELAIPLIGSFSYFPRQISFNTRFLPEFIHTTVSNPILFHLEYEKVLATFNTTLQDISYYIFENSIEVYYSSQYHMGGNMSKNSLLLGNRLLNNWLEISAYKHTKDNLIYFSLGTVCNHNLGIFEETIKFLSTLPYEVIVSSGGNEYIYEALQKFQYTNIDVRYFVNQPEILTKSKIFITHAGAGSVYEGLYFGVPLICMPQDFDQPMNTKRIQELGVGIFVNSSENIQEQLAVAFKDFEENSDKYLANVEKVRQSFSASNTPDAAIFQLESLLTKIGFIEPVASQYCY